MYDYECLLCYYVGNRFIMKSIIIICQHVIVLRLFIFSYLRSSNNCYSQEEHNCAKMIFVFSFIPWNLCEEDFRFFFHSMELVRRRFSFFLSFHGTCAKKIFVFSFIPWNLCEEDFRFFFHSMELVRRRFSFFLSFHGTNFRRIMRVCIGCAIISIL